MLVAVRAYADQMGQLRFSKASQFLLKFGPEVVHVRFAWSFLRTLLLEAHTYNKSVCCFIKHPLFKQKLLDRNLFQFSRLLPKHHPSALIVFVFFKFHNLLRHSRYTISLLRNYSKKFFRFGKWQKYSIANWASGRQSSKCFLYVANKPRFKLYNVVMLFSSILPLYMNLIHITKSLDTSR